MAETVVISFLSKAPTHHKVRDSSAAVDNYVLHGRRANAHSVNHVGTPFGSGLPGAVTNAFEEYMLAHELGHISLGHVTAQQIRYRRALEILSGELSSAAAPEPFPRRPPESQR
jgi:hypothetical protein